MICDGIDNAIFLFLDVSIGVTGMVSCCDVCFFIYTDLVSFSEE